MVGGTECNLVRSCCSRLEMLKVSDSDLDSLPDEMLMQILIRIPAQDIHDSTMFVCWKWYNIICSRSFIYTHLHHSSPGLIIQNLEVIRRTTFMSSTHQGNQFKISNFSYNSKYRCGWASCNGLMLEGHIGLILDGNKDENLELTIRNPVTKQHLTLPLFFVQTKEYPNFTSAIAYEATRMEYKVVRTYYLFVHEYSDANPMVPKCAISTFCAIFTVGVDDSWRHVDTKHLSLTIREHLRSCPLVTRGFVHWTKEYSRYVLTLNIQTEIVTLIPVPAPCKGRCCYYLTGESCLYLLNRRGLLKWEVWEMKPETGEWTKLPDIDLEAHKALLNESCEGDCKLIPAGWLKYREIIVFVAYRQNMDVRFCPNKLRLRTVYNIQTRDISLFKSAESNHVPFLVHKNSLVRIPGG